MFGYILTLYYKLINYTRRIHYMLRFNYFSTYLNQSIFPEQITRLDYYLNGKASALSLSVHCKTSFLLVLHTVPLYVQGISRDR